MKQNGIVLEVQRGIDNTPSDAKGNYSDGYHTFNELYEFRKIYNAALFNEWASMGIYEVHKSKKHFDGDECFGGGWFIVVAVLPSGQISNHYEEKDWDLFKCPEVEKAKFPFDGHTSQDVLLRISELIQSKKQLSKSQIPQHQVATGMKASTSLKGCPFHYCDKQPVCEAACRYE
ncbi:hypothetical protein [Runella sp.]|uniref:WDGH domain-containing protein n=1 Tax=Runella sp. TaxID=1960881 RepID=UPI003D14D300